MHWTERYIGQAWAEDCDCFGWFRRIQSERFGRDVPATVIDHARLTMSAARTMASDIEGRFGWSQTADPAEGDAVFLTQRRRPHHIGLVVDIDGRRHVLHALEGVGIVASDLATLAANGWRIAEYWTCRP